MREGGVLLRQEHWLWDLWYEDVEEKYERKKLEGSAENPVGSAKTVKTLQLNSSCEAEENITVQKTN